MLSVWPPQEGLPGPEDGIPDRGGLRVNPVRRKRVASSSIPIGSTPNCKATKRWLDENNGWGHDGESNNTASNDSWNRPKVQNGPKNGSVPHIPRKVPPSVKTPCVIPPPVKTPGSSSKGNSKGKKGSPPAIKGSFGTKSQSKAAWSPAEDDPYMPVKGEEFDKPDGPVVVPPLNSTGNQGNVDENGCRVPSVYGGKNHELSWIHYPFKDLACEMAINKSTFFVGRVFTTSVEGLEMCFEDLEPLDSEPGVVDSLGQNDLAKRYAKASKQENLMSWLGWSQAPDTGRYLLVYEGLGSFLSASQLIRPECDEYGFAPNSELDWRSRLCIARDVASAMLHLHQHKPPLVHGDLQTGRILFNPNTFLSKITGAGVTPLLRNPKTYVRDISNPDYAMEGFDLPLDCEMAAQGPTSYYDPKYAGKTHPQQDNYAFGVILLELLTGRAPEEKGEGNAQVTYPFISLRDTHCMPKLGPMSDLHASWPAPLVGRIGDVALRCLLPQDNDRPSFLDLRGRMRRFLGNHRPDDPLPVCTDFSQFSPGGTCKPATDSGQDKFGQWWSPCSDPQYRLENCKPDGKPCTRKGCQGIWKNGEPCLFCHDHPPEVLQMFEARRGFARKLRKCEDWQRGSRKAMEAKRNSA